MHPLMQLKLDLEARGLGRELILQYLSKADVEGYLALEFPEHRLPPSFPEFLWQRTEGNPLFMVDLVRDLRDRKIIVQDQGRWILSKPIEEIGDDVPASVRSMIQRKIDSLSEQDRRLLQAASVEGAEFHSVVLAAAVSADAADVEERLENIERIHFFVQRIGEKEFPGRHSHLASPLRARPLSKRAVRDADSNSPHRLECGHRQHAAAASSRFAGQRGAPGGAAV